MSLKTDIKKVVLIGAGGNLGGILLPALLESEAFQVTVLTRASSGASFPASVTVAKTEYSEHELVRIFEGQDAIISAVGAGGFLEQKLFIDAAVQAGVKRFIPSELSSNTLSNAVRQLVPAFEQKKEILDYLKSKESTGLSWTGLATGPLLDWGLRHGFLGFDLAGRKATIWDSGRVSFSATNQRDVGKALVSILSHPLETANKYLYVSTVTTSQSAVLKILEDHTGQRWLIDHVKTGDQIAKGRQMVSEGDFTGMFLLVQASIYGGVEGTRANYAVDEQLANVGLGLPAEGDLDATVEEVIRSC